MLKYYSPVPVGIVDLVHCEAGLSLLGKRLQMLDFILALLFIGMVLTPAIVAARSTHDPATDE